MNVLTLDERMKINSENDPNKIAIECGNKKVTYEQLEERSNKIANFLIDNYNEVKNVFVMTDRTPELIEVLIGVIKSGGVFVPVDPNFPDNKLLGMINEVKTEWIVTKASLLRRIKTIISTLDLKVNILVVDLDDSVQSEEFNSLNIFSLKDYFDIPEKKYEYCRNKHCYIYFTSGSTGKSKAVLGRHKSLMQFIDWEIKEMKVDKEYRVSQLTALSFDVFLRDVFVPICSGGTLCIPEDMKIVSNPIRLLNWIEEKQITLIHTVPSLFKIIASHLKSSEQLKDLKYILLAGEILRGNDVRNFIDLFHERIQLVNLYGPTETTLAKCFYKLKESDANRAVIPVGKPIDFSQVYILNDNMKKCDTGIIGEIYIRTPFITSGYCNDIVLTKKVFIKNPFNENLNDIIYKTGDLGRTLIDGNIEVIGRIDNQVKIRGIRIEIGEVENRLLQYNSIIDAVVVVHEDESNEKNLCAYFTSKDTIENVDLRKYLLQYLPEYMIPVSFVQVDKMTLNSNGKIDRKALSEANKIVVRTIKYEAPRNEVEERLSAIWSEVLGIERVGINENFFELGGHSLKATALIGKIHKELNVEILLKEIFDLPTIKELSRYIESREKNIYEEIKRVEEKEYYDVSSAQKRMFMLQQFDLESTRYNMPRIMVVEGKLDVIRIEKAFTQLIQRHETLRTYFQSMDGKIVQKIHEDVEFKIDYIEKAGNIELTVNNFIRSFDLTKAPLLRVTVVRVEEEKYLLMCDMHHIVSDGTSMRILINELVSIYEEKQLEELKLQYKDYSEWQNKILKSEEMRKREEYWKDRFRDEIPVLNMPTDYVRPTILSFEGDNTTFKLNRELTKGLKDIARESGCTMYMVLLSAINILLSKYSGQEDIIVGSAIAGRPHVDLQQVIGMFVNTLAMRNYPLGNKSYKEFLKEVKENSLKAYENQNYQFEELIDKLNVHRDISRNPLFDVMFTMQNMNSEELSITDLTFKEYMKEHNVAKFDLTFYAAETEEEIILNLEYSTKLYKRETIEIMIEHFKNILSTIANHKNIKINEIDMITEQDKHKLLFEFNNTYAEYARNKTIHELFEEQVEKTPNNVAVIFESDKLTYRELNEKANKLAETLRSKGIKQDSIVAIMVERSLEMIVGILAIMKAGGAYLPIVPEYPEDRVKYILEDSKTNILLTQNRFIKQIQFNGTILDLEDEHVYTGNGDNLQNINTSKSLAYIIYTSGSTGKPKGVMIEHYSVVNRLNWMQKQYPLNNDDVILQKTTYTFDVSVWELFWWSLVGAKVCMLQPDKEKDAKAIADAIEKEKITVIHFVPSMLNVFMDCIKDDHNVNKIKSLKRVFSSGEALGSQQVVNFNTTINDRHKTELINLYGPTEATVDVTYFNCSTQEYHRSIPIGKPIDNISLYILDKNNMIQPIGVAGELCIAGDGLARGYLNNLELTAKKFIDNPFVHGKKMYRTGDLARWLPDGNIEFLGRIDNQVKIRGFRIEIGEIESNLLSHQCIKETVVIDRADKNGTKYLCAYIVSEKELTVAELREYLAVRIPENMIPSYFIKLDKIPLTINGKIDKKALPEPDGTINTGTEYEEPRNEKEQMISEAWQEVLQVNKVGINDNFFDLGGNSLKMIELNNKLNKLFNKEISLISLFRYPNIKSFVSYLSTELDSDVFLDKELDRKDKIVQGKVRANQRIERMRKRGV